MTDADADAFLRLILAAPDDDGPRLLYADWLDENGGPDRAEFIRAQCALAAFPFEVTAAEDWGKVLLGARREEVRWAGQPCTEQQWDRIWAVVGMRCHERELWPPHRVCQPMGLPFLWGCSSKLESYSRGFLCRIELASAVWFAHADAILDACPIRGAKDGLVRLTTWPAESVDARFPERATTEWTARYLGVRYPGVRFELPAQPPYRTRDFTPLFPGAAT